MLGEQLRKNNRLLMKSVRTSQVVEFPESRGVSYKDEGEAEKAMMLRKRQIFGTVYANSDEQHSNSGTTSKFVANKARAKSHTNLKTQVSNLFKARSRFR
mmetsp:Transcript_132/g.171  ORF Transcript_132/g.171 Transcript_132/m.171 type:complete len:100 (+) Transcript_132:2-301(+)